MSDKQRDWPEDFHYENGRYLHECTYCGCRFTGHKRRSLCHVCADECKEIADNLSAVELKAENIAVGMAVHILFGDEDVHKGAVDKIRTERIAALERENTELRWELDQYKKRLKWVLDNCLCEMEIDTAPYMRGDSKCIESIADIDAAMNEDKETQDDE